MADRDQAARRQRASLAVDTAERLRHLINDPAIVAYFDARERMLLDAVVTAPRDERDELVMAVRMLRDLRSHLQSLLAAGKAGARILEDMPDA